MSYCKAVCKNENARGINRHEEWAFILMWPPVPHVSSVYPPAGRVCVGAAGAE